MWVKLKELGQTLLTTWFKLLSQQHICFSLSLLHFKLNWNFAVWKQCHTEVASLTSTEANSQGGSVPHPCFNLKRDNECGVANKINHRCHQHYVSKKAQRWNQTMKLSIDCRLLLSKRKINTRPDGTKLDTEKGGETGFKKTTLPIYRPSSCGVRQIRWLKQVGAGRAAVFPKHPPPTLVNWIVLLIDTCLWFPAITLNQDKPGHPWTTGFFLKQWQSRRFNRCFAL